MRLQLSGQLDLAEAQYRDILASQPAHAAARYCLGMLELQRGRCQQALPHLLEALELRPEMSDYWLGYLEALLLLDRTLEAQAALDLGRSHGLAGSAVGDFARRLAVRTSEATLMRHLTAGDIAGARALARELVERSPESGLAWKALGVFLWADGSYGQAADALRTSVRLCPGDVEALSHLGAFCEKLNLFDEAKAVLERAIQVDAHFAPAHYRLGLCLLRQGKVAAARDRLRAAIALHPECSTSEIEAGYSNLLFALSHEPGMDAESLYAEHCNAGDRIEAGYRDLWPRHANTRDSERRLRIGFVSADLYNHAVSAFLEPLMPHLARHPGLELSAYYSNTIKDDVTRSLRGSFHHWHAVNPSAVPNDRLAKKILDDKIDILVDLSGHTGENRLGAFARKPAPVQVSWLGYPGTTGLRAMDYYLTDRHFLPPGQFDRQFTEKLALLPSTCAFTGSSAVPVNSLPALDSGFITFGSFNRTQKLNAPSIALWSRLLRVLPASRMLIAGIDQALDQERLAAEFSSHGIPGDRLDFRGRGSLHEYLLLHHRVDLCLDTMPYTGGTTTNHALWMGVPTLTIAGATTAARQGAANLGQLGLDAFIATDEETFIARGLHWTRRIDQLADLRGELRPRWMASPARNPAVIAAGIECALRTMWRRWCAGLPPQAFEVDPPAAPRTS